MAYEPVSYTGDANETDYTIGFPYVRSGYVVVELDSVETTAWTFIVSGTKIRFDAPPAQNVIIDISRLTPLVPVVDFVDGAGLPEADLDDVVLQFHHALDETIFNAITGMGKVGGHWDAGFLRIQDVDDAVADDEAPNLGQISVSQVAAAASAAAALVSENAAAADEALTDADAIATAADRVQTGLDAAALPTISGGDAEKFLTINAGEDGYDKESPATIAAVLRSVMEISLFAKKTANHDVGTTTETDIVQLTGLTIPGTPDGVKKYVISGVINAGTDLSWCKVYIGANGTKADTEILQMLNTSAIDDESCIVSEFEFIPGASDTKLGVTVKFSGTTNDDVYGAGTNASYIRIRQVT